MEIIKLTVPVVPPPPEFSLKLTLAELAVIRAGLDLLRTQGKVEPTYAVAVTAAAARMWGRLADEAGSTGFIDNIPLKDVQGIK